jgi:hypothetical protein
MRAELQGKLNHESTVAADRLEDTLTDAVFSALRYLPRRLTLRGVLLRILPRITFSDAELDRAEIVFCRRCPLWCYRDAVSSRT